MKTTTYLAGACLAILAVTGCRRETEAVSVTTLTSASVIGRDDAAVQIARAQCRRELECASSNGNPTPFDNEKQCVAATTQRLNGELACSYVEPRQLAACTKRARGTICDDVPQSGVTAAGCGSADLCASDPAAP